eukprot:6334158-Amphidinium_carterae.1
MAARSPRMSLVMLKHAIAELKGLSLVDKEPFRVLLSQTWITLVAKNEYQRSGARLPPHVKAFCDALQTAKAGIQGKYSSSVLLRSFRSLFGSRTHNNFAPQKFDKRSVAVDSLTRKCSRVGPSLRGVCQERGKVGLRQFQVIWDFCLQQCPLRILASELVCAAALEVAYIAAGQAAPGIPDLTRLDWKQISSGQDWGHAVLPAAGGGGDFNGLLLSTIPKAGCALCQVLCVQQILHK